MSRGRALLFVAWLSLAGAPVWGQIVCPPIRFLTAHSADIADGQFVRLMERLPNGEYTARSYRRSGTFNLAGTEQDFGARFLHCVPSPPSGGAPIPPGPRTLGNGSTDVLYIPDVGNGAPAGIWSVYSGDSIWVFEGNAERALTKRTTYTVAAYRAGLLSADYDGDQLPDIAVLTTNADREGALAILKGNGDATFRAPTFHRGLAEFGTSMAQSDFNRDGFMDFAIAFNSGGHIQILLGNGNGTFRDGQKVTDAFPFTVSVGDVNRDGVVDLISGSDAITVFLGRGDGTFAAGTTLPAGGQVRYIALGDLNKDGNVDVAVASKPRGTVSVLAGAGNGTFGAPRSYAAGRDLDSLIFVDFNNDGHLDIATATGQPDALGPSNDNGIVGVLLGRGDLTFVAAPALLEDRAMTSFAAGDLNGDGRRDLVVGLDTTTVLTFLQRADGGFTRTATTGSVRFDALAVGDFNRDGPLDVAGIDRNQGLAFLRGNGDGTFRAATVTPFSGSARPEALASADFTGDGILDLALVYPQGSTGVAIATGNGSGGFSIGAIRSAGIRPNSITVGDINGDGRPDIVIGDPGIAFDPESDGLFVLRNNGGGAFAPATRIPFGVMGNRPTLADVNGDSKLDLLASAQGPNFTWFWSVFLNDGTGAFAETERISTGFGPGQIEVADFSGDGRADVSLLHCCGDVQPGLYVGNGDGSFQNETFHDVGGDASAQLATDLDGDGKADLGVMSQHGITVLRNMSGASQPFVSVSAASFYFGPAAPESIVTAFGAGLALRQESASVVPLPTQLGGASMKIRDSAGAERDIQMFFASPNQVNYLLPAGLAAGRAVISIQPEGGAPLESELEIAAVAPGVFVSDAQRTAAALLLRVKPSGEQIVEEVVELVNGVVVPRPIEFGEDRLFLLLFATGLRKAGRVDLRVGGRMLTVSYFGPQGDFVGLDQVNAELTRDLVGAGLVTVDLVADSVAANKTRLLFR